MTEGASDTLYLRYRGRVTGPFTREHLDLLREAGRLSRFHEVSVDRTHWAPALAARSTSGAASASTRIPSTTSVEPASDVPTDDDGREEADAESTGKADRSAAPEARGVAEAYIKWRCDCGERLTIEAAERGNQVECPSCDALVVVPARSTPESTDDRVDDPDDARDRRGRIDPRDPDTADHAGLPQRAAATLIDALVVALVAAVGNLTLDLVIDADAPLRQPVVIVPALLALQWLYLACMESSPLRATLGKFAIGLRVSDLEGGGIGFGRATARHLGRFLSALPLGAGYVMIAFSARHQALHDLMSRTLVVHTRPAA